jgi:hypothetical protein
MYKKSKRARLEFCSTVPRDNTELVREYQNRHIQLSNATGKSFFMRDLLEHIAISVQSIELLAGFLYFAFSCSVYESSFTS